MTTGDAGLQVGFIGLGRQGALIVEELLGSRFPLQLWARRPEVLDRYRTTRASLAPSLEVMARSSNVVGVCVVDDAGVFEVVGGPGGLFEHMAPGGVVMVHSTVTPVVCQELAVIGAGCGVGLIDAPVSNASPRRAASPSQHGVSGPRDSVASMAVMVGGSNESVDRCLPVLEVFGDPVLRLGEVGSGQLAKLLSNLVFYSSLAIAYDSLQVGSQMGMDIGALATILRHTSARSVGVEWFAERAGEGIETTADVMRKRFGSLLSKDLELVGPLIAECESDLLRSTSDRAREVFGASAKPTVSEAPS